MCLFVCVVQQTTPIPAQHDNNQCGYLADNMVLDLHAYYGRRQILTCTCIYLRLPIIRQCGGIALTAGYGRNANGSCKQFSWKLCSSARAVLASLQGQLNCNVSLSSWLLTLLASQWTEFVIRCYERIFWTITIQNYIIFIDEIFCCTIQLLPL